MALVSALLNALLNAIADAAAPCLFHMTRLQGHGLKCRQQWLKALQHFVLRNCHAVSVAGHDVAGSALNVPHPQCR